MLFKIENNSITIFVNKDIKLGNGKTISQIGHAICSYLYNSYIKYIYDIDITSFIAYIEVQKKIALKCTNDSLKAHCDESKAIFEVNEEVIALNMGIFDRNLNEVPDWIRNLKLYSK